METSQTLFYPVIRTDTRSPDIVGRYNGAMWNIPIKVYFHRSFEQAFDDSAKQQPNWKNAMDHLSDIVDREFDSDMDLKGYDYNIAMIWGKKKDKMIDLLGYYAEDTTVWPGTTKATPLIFKNGIYRPKEHELCKDTAMILHAEEVLRKRCDGMAEFLFLDPDIFGITFTR